MAFGALTGRNDTKTRTTARARVSPHGYRVEAVPFRECLHPKTAATLVGDDAVLCNPEWVDGAALGAARVIAVRPAEPFGGDAVRVGGVVIYPAELPRTRERIERAGFRVLPVPAGELAKAEGGVTCCSLLVR